MITGPGSYLKTITSFDQHWLSANLKLLQMPVVIGLTTDKTTITQPQFAGLHGTLQTQQNLVQSALTSLQIARGNVNVQKAALLPKFGMFTSLLDGYYQGTGFYEARPYAPTFNDGKEIFLRPLGAMMTLWAEINAGPAPAAVTLPLVLADGTQQATFASELSALAFTFADMERKDVLLQLARGNRNVTQAKAYETMKLYRELATAKFAMHPELMETLPRLTPLPGHTPARVNASAVYEASNQSKIVYDESKDSMVDHYELRATAGDEYNDEDAVVIASNEPGDAREFVTPFGLSQPGARVAFKVFVILNTGNEAGSAAMFVQRPVSLSVAA